jgi:methylamine--corrinoid protein Co-methyltransferase
LYPVTAFFENNEEISMISLLEIWDRAQNGKLVNEKEWNMGLFHKLTELTKKYDIRRKKDEWINTDEEVLDRVFEAAIEFISGFGVYCRDLRRVIRFSEEEVRQAVEAAPSEITVGAGNEKATINHMDVEDKRIRNVLGGGHMGFSHDLIPLVVKNLVETLPRIDYMEGMNFKEIDGREINNVGLASYAHVKAIEAQKEGLRMAGKPGIAIALYPISTAPVCMTSPIGMKNGLRKTDGVMLSVLPDFKIESGFITAAIIYEEFGAKLRVNGSDGFCGGSFVGSPQNAIIENVAKAIAAWMCYGDTLHNATVKHTDSLAGKYCIFGDISWASSVATQTIARKTNFIGFADGGFAHELGSLESFKTITVKAIRGTVSGANIWVVRNFTPPINCGISPLETLFYIEVADAVVKSGIKREEANNIVTDWVEELDRNRAPEKKGITITDVWDLDKGEPTKEQKDKYESIKDELRKRKLPID